jgi:hypothetical protein
MTEHEHLADIWCRINAYDLVGPSEVMLAIEQIVGVKACTDRWEAAYSGKRGMIREKGAL